MPSACPGCGQRVRVGALRCRYCGADARAAEPLGLGFGDAMDDATIEALAFEILGEARGRRMKAVARLKEIAPEVVTWASSDEATRGPSPPPAPEHAAEVAAILAALDEP